MTRQKASKVFISHAGRDKPFATLVAERLHEADMVPWVDAQQIMAGDDILAKIGDGLATMDLLILIVSGPALRSQWVRREVSYASMREAEATETLILPFIIDETPLAELPWQIASKNAQRVLANENGATQIAVSVKQVLKRRSGLTISGIPHGFERDAEVDALVRDVRNGDWPSAQRAALEVVGATDVDGRNAVFERLLEYQDTDDDELLWKALPVLEACVSLVPSLLSRRQLNRMGTHPNFSVRSAAASICHDMAQHFPHMVPLDLLIKLSVASEDWYVEAPAMAALKTLAHHMPAVLRVFYLRLHGKDSEDRLRAAQALDDIAAKEPELLDSTELSRHLAILASNGETDTSHFVRSALGKLKSVEPTSLFTYRI